MPELPEVEHVRRTLDKLLRGRLITDVLLKRERLAPSHTPRDFSRLLSYARVNSVHRRGKHILIDLSTGRTLIVHLRMSGRFMLLPAEAENPRFAHATFDLDGDERLVFEDQRHFGFMRIVETDRLDLTPELAKLAPEPLADAFSAGYVFAASRPVRRSLKEFLLDQTRICGLGNIYACEALFLAGIDPRKPARSLSRPRAARLHASILHVLTEAIEHSSRGEIDPADIGGGYYNGPGPYGWLVYDREGQACVNCNQPINRLKQGGRSTFFCRKCQR